MPGPSSEIWRPAPDRCCLNASDHSGGERRRSLWRAPPPTRSTTSRQRGPTHSSSPLEFWTPRWVGLGIPRSERYELVRRHEKAGHSRHVHRKRPRVLDLQTPTPASANTRSLRSSVTPDSSPASPRSAKRRSLRGTWRFLVEVVRMGISQGEQLDLPRKLAQPRFTSAYSRAHGPVRTSTPPTTRSGTIGRATPLHDRLPLFENLHRS